MFARTAGLIFFVACFTSCSTALCQKKQPPFPLAHSSATSQHVQIAFSEPEVLNNQAAANDPTGIHTYSHDLIKLIVPEQAREELITQLSDRLARAEQAAREGKAKLIPEREVPRAFNELMRRTGAPSSYMADEADVHNFRMHAIDVPILPNLLTPGRNGSNCNPGEAVFLVYLMIENNGKLPQQLLDTIAKIRRNAEDVRHGKDFAVNSREYVPLMTPIGPSGVISSYSARHSRRATSRVFDEFAKTLHF